MKKAIKPLPNPLHKPSTPSALAVQFIIFMIVGSLLMYIYYGSLTFPHTFRGIVGWLVTPLLAALVTAYIYRLVDAWKK